MGKLVVAGLVFLVLVAFVAFFSARAGSGSAAPRGDGADWAWPTPAGLGFPSSTEEELKKACAARGGTWYFGSCSK